MLIRHVFIGNTSYKRTSAAVKARNTAKNFMLESIARFFDKTTKFCFYMVCDQAEQTNLNIFNLNAH